MDMYNNYYYNIIVYYRYIYIGTSKTKLNNTRDHAEAIQVLQLHIFEKKKIHHGD